MTIKVELSALEQIAQDAIGGVEIYPEYSGRGMYGDTCFGVVTDIRGFAAFVALLVEQVTENELSGQGHVLAEFRDGIDRVSTDNMGLNTIFYWPGVQVEAQ